MDNAARWRGWGNIREVAYRPNGGQNVTWSARTEYTHDAILVENRQGPDDRGLLHPKDRPVRKSDLEEDDPGRGSAGRRQPERRLYLQCRRGRPDRVSGHQRQPDGELVQHLRRHGSQLSVRDRNHRLQRPCAIAHATADTHAAAGHHALLRRLRKRRLQRVDERRLAGRRNRVRSIIHQNDRNLCRVVRLGCSGSAFAYAPASRLARPSRRSR